MTITCPGLGVTGRLGNQLWEIASTLGVARKLGQDVRFPHWEYTPYFNVDESWFCQPNETLQGTPIDTVPETGHLGPYARPYLQDYSLIAHIEDEVRHIFEPTPFALKSVPLDGLEALPGSKLALHVRRGDNASAHERGEQDYQPLRPLSYYFDALASLQGYESIVVFSDDIPWCRTTFVDLASAVDGNILFYEGGPARSRECEDRYLVEPVLDWVDLVAMTHCEQFIISNSTYSWWAAFLSGVPGEDIRYPDASVWFGRKLKMIDASLMFPPSWVPTFHPQG